MENFLRHIQEALDYLHKEVRTVGKCPFTPFGVYHLLSRIKSFRKRRISLNLMLVSGSVSVCLFVLMPGAPGHREPGGAYRHHLPEEGPPGPLCQVPHLAGQVRFPTKPVPTLPTTVLHHDYRVSQGLDQSGFRCVESLFVLSTASCVPVSSCPKKDL